MLSGEPFTKSCWNIIVYGQGRSSIRYGVTVSFVRIAQSVFCVGGPICWNKTIPGCYTRLSAYRDNALTCILSMSFSLAVTSSSCWFMRSDARARSFSTPLTSAANASSEGVSISRCCCSHRSVIPDEKQMH